MTVHRNSVFSDSSEVLDGNEYHDCIFQNCRLIFRGQQQPVLSGNRIENSRLVFEGPALETLRFILGLAHPNSGLSEFLKQSFPNLPLTLQQKTRDRDPAALHAEMLRRITAVEETIAKLPTETPPGIGHNQPPPPTDSDIEEIKRDIAMLKAQPPVPAQPPPEASAAVSRMNSVVQKILAYAGKQADNFATEAVKTAGRAVPILVLLHDQLVALINSIVNWITALGP